MKITTKPAEVVWVLELSNEEFDFLCEIVVKTPLGDDRDMGDKMYAAMKKAVDVQSGDW